MKILFVCRGNVGRSQIAETVFNQRTSGEHSAFSAGTWVKDKEGTSMHGKKLHDFESAKEVVLSLREIGIDAGENKRDQIDEAMVEEADLIVVMAEEHTIPEFLKRSQKVRYWEVEDPKGMSQEDTNRIRDEIIRRVQDLIFEIDTTYKRNQFGLLSTAYDRGRSGYPQELFDYLKNISPRIYSATIDLGCGTGISTRQLKERGYDVIGVDRDSAMINIARTKDDSIQYVVANVERLPFDDQQFDVATAFTSFHWFANERSIAEIKRVLKQGGVFMTALKQNAQTDETKDFRVDYRAVLTKYVGNEFDSSKNHKPKALLEQYGFTDIQEKTFSLREHYTPSEALELVQSFSLWNLVPDNLKKNFLKDMSEVNMRHLVDGHIIRDWDIVVAVGRKLFHP